MSHYRASLRLPSECEHVSPRLADETSVLRWLREVAADHAVTIDVSEVLTPQEAWLRAVDACPACRKTSGGFVPCKLHNRPHETHTNSSSHQVGG